MIRKTELSLPTSFPSLFQQDNFAEQSRVYVGQLVNKRRLRGRRKTQQEKITREGMGAGKASLPLVSKDYHSCKPNITDGCQHEFSLNMDVVTRSHACYD